jgi:hypothetical protein
MSKPATDLIFMNAFSRNSARQTVGMPVAKRAAVYWGGNIKLVGLLFLSLGVFAVAPVARAADLPTLGKPAFDFGSIGSPILFRGDATTAYRDPAVIYHEGVFRIFFTLTKIDPEKQVHLYCAWSKSRDLVHWSEPKIFTPRDQNLNFSSPGNIFRFGNEWVLCLQTYPRPNGEPGGNADSRIWIMRSQDLETWGPAELLRVKGPDVPREKMGRMIDPFLIEDRNAPGKWWCFYKTGAAWSHDLQVWTPDRQRPPGENSCVVIDGSDYVMFFSPNNGVGIRRSKNLLDWREDGLLLLGQDEWTWAQGRLTAGFVLDLRREAGWGKAFMFFHGSDFPEKDPRGGFDNFASIGLAWSDDLKNWNWPGKTLETTKIK